MRKNAPPLSPTSSTKVRDITSNLEWEREYQYEIHSDDIEISQMSMSEAREVCKHWWMKDALDTSRCLPCFQSWVSYNMSSSRYNVDD
ncbi:uncharacterized protein G2W53_001005 [Senna tora]|uniref:Uncharacterized protein n=1 Tax=Senna tora TaxID=362788 RepID=A0A834XGN9_9FABA|nr:uncharacterized protein G2W53_001005 [Senna tora]